MPTLEARVDEGTYVLLRAAANAARSLKIEWMVTGAAGRILLLEKVYGRPPGRATEDVDVGVMVEDWNGYRALVEHICRDAAFQPDAKQAQRLRHREGLYLDIIPFGGVEAVDHSIRWASDDAFVMNVTGFEDAHADAVRVRVRDLSVPVVSPIGLVLLKLVAWKDRHQIKPRRDAPDIAYVLRHFSALLTEEVLFEEHFDVVDELGYDLDLAATRVLGQKVATIASPDTREYLRRVLTLELKAGAESRLVQELTDYFPAGNEERVYDLLNNMKTGFNEAR